MFLGKDINAEAMAIGCALQWDEPADALLSLDEAEMETAQGSEILAAMKFLRSQGVKIDLITVDAQTGGRHTKYLIDASANSITSVHFEAYVGILREKAKRRKIAGAATKLLNVVGDLNEDADDAAAEFVASLKKVSHTEGRAVTAQEATVALAESLDEKVERRAMFGVGVLDDLLGGMFGEKLVVLGARPATGKSALALCAAMATQGNGAVLYCSYEMSPVAIMGRALANLSGVNSEKIAYRKLDGEDYQVIVKHYPEAAAMNIHFLEDANTPAKVRVEALRLQKEANLALIVIDYLQLMSSGQKAESRRVEVGQISRALKALAMELNIPVLALSQLNRQSEATASKEPTMSELRESGDIEQDADVIVLMYAPPITEDIPRKVNAAGFSCVRMILEKNRGGGGVGRRFNTAFSGARMKFLRIAEVLGSEV